MIKLQHKRNTHLLVVLEGEVEVVKVLFHNVPIRRENTIGVSVARIVVHRVEDIFFNF